MNHEEYYDNVIRPEVEKEEYRRFETYQANTDEEDAEELDETQS